MNYFLILLGKTLSFLFRTFNLGNGSTWPGHIALNANPQFINQLVSKSKIKIILIAGTNGKTTTATLIKTVLEKNGKKVIQNQSGANLLNGIASTLLLHANAWGKLPYDFGIFEVDENALPLVLKEITPDYLLLMNLFRDQLDRYGEINTIARKWQVGIQNLPKTTKLIINADDPQIAFIGLKNNILPVEYFGLHKSSLQTAQLAADSIYCANCGNKLHFSTTFFSHLGIWMCLKCKLKHPVNNLDKVTFYPLPGTYNQYNTHAAVLLLQRTGLKEKEILEGLKDFKPAFGRQEIVHYKNKNVQLFLSKNPTSFNQSYTTIKDLGAKYLLLVLNDRIPDGRDVSWIWDADMPDIHKFDHIFIAGDRVYDMALRVKYEDFKSFSTYQNLSDAIHTGIQTVPENETLYILPTYSAMLEVRKIITGKKIL